MFDVTVVGATGLVGAELIRILAERSFPLKRLKALASSRSVGESVEFGNLDLAVEALDGFDFQGSDLVIFATPPSVSAEYVPLALAAGSRVLDLSGHFASDAQALLALAGLSGAELKQARLVAAPVSPAVALSLALAPILKVAAINQVTATALLPVSHSGVRGVRELETQVRDLLSFQEPQVQLYAHQIAFNLLPQVGDFESDGRTSLEAATAVQTARLVGLEPASVAVSCCRTPVFYGLGLSVDLEIDPAVPVAELRDRLRGCDGLKLEDNLAHNSYPLPIYAAGQDEVCIGRLRSQRPGRLSLFIAMDNLRRGSALNAVELAEAMLR